MLEMEGIRDNAEDGIIQTTSTEEIIFSL